MAFKITAPKRTEGDGMEHASDDDVESPNLTEMSRKTIAVGHTKKEKTSQDLNFHQSSLFINFKMAPKLQRHVSGSSTNKKKKEPKFVPFEPYKAAVRPMIPNKKYSHINSKAFTWPQTDRRHVTSCSSDLSENDDKPVDNSQSCDEYGKEITKLRLENKELEKQLQLQVQVNGDLKNLLVAAMGEDMETRVHCLTEDKQHLAQKLINSAKHLSTHQEQVEWLANQCEVWRSKFLASSVMVEELARWKAYLSHKISEGEDILKKILEERKIVRKNLLVLHSSLMMLRDNFDLLSKKTLLKTSNVIDLSAYCATVAQGLIPQLLGGSKLCNLKVEVQELPHFTEAEKAADYMLKHPHNLSLIGEPDTACNAVVGAAVALNSQLYHQNNPPRIACCPHCTGQIKLV